MSNPHNHFYEFGPFRLDLSNRLLLRDGEVVPLKKKAYEMLLVLVENNGQVLEKEELMRRLWPDTYVEESNLTHYIYTLRRVLGDEKDNPQFIVTIPGRGYRFTDQVRKHQESDQEDEPMVIERHTLSRVVITETPEKIETPLLSLPPAAPTQTNWKVWAGSGIAGLILALTAGFYFGFNRQTSAPKNSAAPVAKIVPFTGSAGRENHPAFSPDGKQLAFTWRPDGSDNLDIYVKLIGAGEPLRLTQSSDADVFPAWSPDGRFIAWVRAYGDFNEIYVVPALGGVERRIFKTRQAVWSSVSWTVDGKQLAIADAEQGEDQSSIFLIPVEGGETNAKLRLTQPPPGANDSWPAIAPDGQAIAFRRIFNDSLTELFVLDAPGQQLDKPADKQARQLTAEQAVIEGFTWMPDGRELLYSLNRNGSASLQRIRADKPQPGRGQPFGAAGRKAFFPTISPDGEQIAFVEPLDDANIWQLAPAGKPRKLIASNHADHSAQLSPDGQRVVFVSDRSGGEELWRCRADGSNQQQLTQRNAPTGSPRWSPDGRWILFDSREDGNSELFLISAEGGPLRRLTRDKANDSLPCWSPDGQTVYFRSNRSGSQQLWKMPAQGGAATQLTQQGIFECFASPDGKFVYYSKGRGINGLWRVGVDGTEEQPVPELADAGYWRAWMITAQGLYYVANTDSLPLPLKLFNFTTRQSRIVTMTEHAPAWLPHSLGVSADGRQILLTQSDLFSSSILLMKDFR